MKYINKSKEIIVNKYNDFNEDDRLTKSIKGQLEFFTTMHYILKYLKPNSKILEVGAGTGIYSLSLAKKGYQVNAIELVEKNVDILKQNIKLQKNKNIIAEQGDALDLTRFKDNTFDMVLVLGPLYHLFNKKDQNRAIDEALRVCKTNGIVMFAFITDDSIVFNWGLHGHLKYMQENIFNKDYSLKQVPEEVFATFNIYNFEKLFKDKKIKKLHLISTDSILETVTNNPNLIIDKEDFEIFKKYHLATCERVDLLGLASHLLYICKKI